MIEQLIVISSDNDGDKLGGIKGTGRGMGLQNEESNIHYQGESSNNQSDELLKFVFKLFSHMHVFFFFSY